MLNNVAITLSEFGVPNRIAADMLDLSLSTYHRKRNTTPSMRASVYEDVTFELRDEPKTLEELLGTLHHLNSADVRMAVYHLNRTKLIEKRGKKLHLSSDTHLPSRIDASVLLAASQKGTTRKEISDFVGVEPSIVNEYIDRAIEGGSLLVDEDGLLQTNALFWLDGTRSEFDQFLTVKLIFNSVIRSLIDRLEDLEIKEGESTLSYWKIPVERLQEYQQLQREFDEKVDALLDSAPLRSESFFEAFVGRSKVHPTHEI